MMIFSRLKPSVPKCWLFAMSGLMWSAVGIMMCARGAVWLSAEEPVQGLAMGLVGVVVAVFAFRKSFSNIALQNIQRLRCLPDRGCFFAFQAWKSYILIVFMIGLGLVLRQSSIPENILAVVYLAIGGALLLGSFLYYHHLARMIRASGSRFAPHRKHR